MVQRLGADGKPFPHEELNPPIGPSEWVMLTSPRAELADNLSFLGQMFTGPLCGVAGYLSQCRSACRSAQELLAPGGYWGAIYGHCRNAEPDVDRGCGSRPGTPRNPRIPRIPRIPCI